MRTGMHNFVRNDGVRHLQSHAGLAWDFRRLNLERISVRPNKICQNRSRTKPARITQKGLEHASKLLWLVYTRCPRARKGGSIYISGAHRVTIWHRLRTASICISMPYDVFWYLMAPTATHSHTSNNLSQQIPNRFQKKSQVKSLCLKITEKVSFNMSGQNLTKNTQKYIENQKLTPKYFKCDILSYFQTL